jgi:hypothetical protein
MHSSFLTIAKGHGMNQSHSKIAVLSVNPKDTQDLCSIIEDGPYLPSIYSDLSELKTGLCTEAHMAAILDLDSVSIDNRTIRRLTLEFPSVCFFSTSRHFHPELKDAICYHLFACLRKPVDPDELLYWLKSIATQADDAPLEPT